MKKGSFDFNDTPSAKTDETDETPQSEAKLEVLAGSVGFVGASELENEPSPFPLDALPSIPRTMAEEIAKAALVPDSLAAINVLGFLSASIGGGLLVDSGGGRITPANIFLLGIAESGTGKGRAFSMASKAFQDIEAEEVAHWESEVLPSIKADLRLIEKNFKKLEKSLDKGGEAINRETTKKEIQDLEKQKAELERQLASEAGLSVGDITKEKLAITLESQPGQALASLSPEGRGVIDVLMGKYGKGSESDEDLYLSSYSRESVKVSRVSRPPIHLSTPCLSVLWLIQPDKARKLTESEAITESGLLPRFLFCDSKAEAMDEPEEPYTPSPATLLAWGELVQDILETFRSKGEEPSTIETTREARSVLIQFSNECKRRIRKDGDLRDIAPFVARWGENAWRLALVLHAAKHGNEAGKTDLEQDTANNAVKIVRWFAEEQLAILAPERSNRNRVRLSRLLSVLADHQGERTLRDLKKNNGFKEEEIEQLAKEFPSKLEIETRKSDSPQGGRSSKVVKLKLNS